MAKMYRENFIESLRKELVDKVEDELSPLALKYSYSEVSLEVNIKWRPVVLVLGNYSSGKSTLINELIGADIQATGQAPTDDSFTVITYSDHESSDKPSAKIEEQREGKVLLYDESYPFENLRRHGERFAAHFRLLKVDSPFLKDVSLIDTPGMLDSSSERDRGYDYQEVVGDLAQIADLILILFDPHKAGTIRETHLSLKETLPARTFEDRVVFVLNRIDECNSLNDLLRVYGTLCWNLSQMTGRKDIPQICFTYSDQSSKNLNDEQRLFLNLLKNQREELKSKILQAPKYRLDHLTSYIETHGERLCHYLEALESYSRERSRFKLKNMVVAFILAVTSGIAAAFYFSYSDVFSRAGQTSVLTISIAIGVVLFIVGLGLLQSLFLNTFHRGIMANLDRLTPLSTQRRKDSWSQIKKKLQLKLASPSVRLSKTRIKLDRKKLEKSYQETSRAARRALGELGALPSDKSST